MTVPKTMLTQNYVNDKLPTQKKTIKLFFIVLTKMKTREKYITPTMVLQELKILVISNMIYVIL